MSNIENLLYKAYHLGKRDEMLEEVSKIRDANPYASLDTIYEIAYDKINCE
tara:strand:+ start:598 stop:750 length:153 start_codon:yes stop_codon:yes gene_type:complete